MPIAARVIAAAALAACALAGCSGSGKPALLGTLEWDRISVPAEASERVLRLEVSEGAQVKAGDLLLRLDGQRMDARLAQAQAIVEQSRARLSELIHGARSEQLDASRAELASARASRVEAAQQHARMVELSKKQLVARSSLDAARAGLDRSTARVAAAEAQLLELTQGTRPEQISQAQAALAAALASLEELRLSRSHLEIRAPRAGRVDALPFKAGDQPPVGASVASLLVGSAPYARVFVPTSSRVGMREGQKFLVRVQGSDHDLHATLRSIAHEPSFTPYYALTGDDASRLVYRAEMVLTDPEAGSLPAGVPVQVHVAN
jgi:HlyD family secretion protein